MKETIDHERLEAVASGFYSALIAKRGGSGDEVLVRRAYAEAARFLKTGEEIRAGRLSVAPVEEPPVEYVKIPIVRLGADGVTFEPATDALGQTMSETVQRDPYAVALNLPADHPVNLRGCKDAAALIEERKRERIAERERIVKADDRSNLMNRIGALLAN